MTWSPYPLSIPFHHSILYHLKSIPEARSPNCKPEIIALKLYVASKAFHIAHQYFSSCLSGNKEVSSSRCRHLVLNPRTWQHHASVNQQNKLGRCSNNGWGLSSCSRRPESISSNGNVLKLRPLPMHEIDTVSAVLSGSDALLCARSKDVRKDVAGHGDKPKLSATYIKSGRQGVLAPSFSFTYRLLAYKHRLTIPIQIPQCALPRPSSPWPA